MVGELSPSGSYIRSLIDKRNEYATELNSGSEYISAPQSGIVSYRIDGLEEVLSAKTQDFSYLSIETLENLNLKTGQIIATSEEAGKIINNFKCYIAIPLSSENAKEATVGDNVMLRLASSKEVEATIEYIAKEGESQLIFGGRTSRRTNQLSKNICRCRLVELFRTKNTKFRHCLRK